MLVKVTAENIKNGVPKDANCCPIALALVEMGFREVEVQPDGDICFEDQNRVTYACEVPDCALTFMALFDAGEPVEPFEMEIS